MVRWNKKFKVLQCYICILGWLGVILLCLSYWRTESNTAAHPPLAALKGHDEQGIEGTGSGGDKPRLKKLRQLCNSPDRIHTAGEGRLAGTPFELVGVVVSARHGDRGPLVPVRNLTDINCGPRSYFTTVYKQFVADVLNVSKTVDYSSFSGPFFKFPVLPSLYKCNVAHLTPQGVVQHLKLGRILKEVYIKELDLLSNSWEVDDIIVYSTKFRRTFQSVLAFLHGFLPKFDLSQIHLQEGRGISFCSTSCRCDRVAVLDEQYDQERKAFRKSHPGVLELVEKLSALVKDGAGAPDIVNPVMIRDALMAYTCHGHRLPCRGGVCVQAEDVSSIVSYEEWESRQKKSRARHRASKLKAYGMLRDIVRTVDTMMRDGKPKVLLYWGHDKTLNYLLNSLGLPVYQLPHYASRVIFEVYHNTTSNALSTEYRQNYFFRIVYNGKDLTKFLTFCNSKVLSHFTGGNGIRNSISICPVGSLDNFIRASNYFAEFNATSFKEACTINRATATKLQAKINFAI